MAFRSLLDRSRCGKTLSVEGWATVGTFKVGESWNDLTGSNGEAMANGRQNSERQLADVHHDHHTSEQDCQHAQYAEMGTQAGAAVAEDVRHCG